MSPDQQIAVFGETVEQMIFLKPSFESDTMYAMQILSDAQEVLARGDAERARQFINKAKFFLTKQLEKERG